MSWRHFDECIAIVESLDWEILEKYPDEETRACTSAACLVLNISDKYIVAVIYFIERGDEVVLDATIGLGTKEYNQICCSIWPKGMGYYRMQDSNWKLVSRSCDKAFFERFTDLVSEWALGLDCELWLQHQASEDYYDLRQRVAAQVFYGYVSRLQNLVNEADTQEAKVLAPDVGMSELVKAISMAENRNVM